MSLSVKNTTSQKPASQMTTMMLHIMHTNSPEPTSRLRYLIFPSLVLLVFGSCPAKVNATTTTVQARSSDADPLDPLRAWLEMPADQRPELLQQPFSKQPLSRPQADQARLLLWEDFRQQQLAVAQQTIEKGIVTDGAFSMKFAAKVFGEKPERGHSLFLSLHGGGGAPARVNDGQWENQKRLYSPKEGVYVAPRAPTDTWNLWHQAHVDGLFRQIIEAFVISGQVDPNRVYIMGYSAGGDGVYQVAPRMADSFAAAAMMAGHPNEASPLGLRNIGFTIHMGANDSAYNRNQVARQWGDRLDELQQQDPDGYPHETVIHEGKGHWMDRQDAIALDFMTRFDRQPNPVKVVWYQDDVTRDRCYWLAISPDQEKLGTTVTATVREQTVTVDTNDLDRLILRFSDSLLDLDQPINFVVNGKEVSSSSLERTIGTLWSTLQQTRDPELIWSAQYELQITPLSTENPSLNDGSK